MAPTRVQRDSSGGSVPVARRVGRVEPRVLVDRAGPSEEAGELGEPGPERG